MKTKRWRKTVIHNVQARQLIIEYPNGTKFSYHQDQQKNVAVIRIHAKPREREL